MTTSKPWSLYILVSETKNRTYVGVTTDLQRRVRQHNGELKGGARSTRGHGPWKAVVEVPHLEKKRAHKMEYQMHRLGRTRRPKGCSNLEKRLRHLAQVCNNFEDIWFADRNFRVSLKP